MDAHPQLFGDLLIAAPVSNEQSQPAFAGREGHRWAPYCGRWPRQRTGPEQRVVIAAHGLKLVLGLTDVAIEAEQRVGPLAIGSLHNNGSHAPTLTTA